LQRLGKAILTPIALSVAGVLSAEAALRLIVPQRIISQLLTAGLGFGVVYLLSTLVRPVRDEVLSLRKLLSELRLTGQAV